MKLNEQDERALHKLDDSFTIDAANEVATISGPITIKIARVADDRLEMVIEFTNIEFPVLMSRTQTMKQLGV